MLMIEGEADLDRKHMGAAPMFAVIVPTHNRAYYSARAIRSVLAQRRAADEIIIVDDCSSDTTVAELGREFGDSIKILSNAENVGPGGSRNIGAAAARSKWICFLD